MRKIFIGISAAFALLLASVGCTADKTTYSGPDYIMFSDSLYVFPVQSNESYFNVPVTATQTCSYDRTLGVEVIDKSSNAIEGRHYALESNSVTIKAGERVGHVKVRGIYDNIDIYDSLGFALQLVSKEDSHWNLYGINTKVVLEKSCPLDMNNFTGYCVITSTYFTSYSNKSMRVTKSVIDPDDKNTIILKDYFFNGYDVKVKITTNDVMNPLIKMEEQVFGPTDEAFGTLYGNGKIMMYQPASGVSYYSSCENFIFQYMTLYVDEVGVVGTFANIVKWISDDEARKLIEQGY